MKKILTMVLMVLLASTCLASDYAINQTVQIDSVSVSRLSIDVSSEVPRYILNLVYKSSGVVVKQEIKVLTHAQVRVIYPDIDATILGIKAGLEANIENVLGL